MEVDAKVNSTRQSLKTPLFFLGAIAAIFAGFWLLHENRHELEIVALHPLLAPIVSGGIAIALIAAIAIFARRSHARWPWLHRGAFMALTLAALALGGISIANGIAAAHASKIQPASIRLSVAGNSLQIDIKGSIDRHLPFRVSEALADVSKCRVTIQSLGGDLSGARRTGDIIEERHCAVRVRDKCASACVVIWASAAKRELARGSMIGVHRISLDGKREGSELANRLNNGSVARLRKAGFDPARLELAMSSSDVTWLSAEELQEWGVRFEITKAEYVRTGPIVSGGNVRFLGACGDSGIDCDSKRESRVRGEMPDFQMDVKPNLLRSQQAFANVCESGDSDVKKKCVEMIEMRSVPCLPDVGFVDRSTYLEYGKSYAACVMPRPICRGREVVDDAALEACGTQHE